MSISKVHAIFFFDELKLINATSQLLALLSLDPFHSSTFSEDNRWISFINIDFYELQRREANADLPPTLTLVVDEMKLNERHYRHHAILRKRIY